MKCPSIYMGKLVTPWMNKKNIKYVTFSVTDDCNLRCAYCYFTHKSDKHKMTFEVAQKAIDYILSEEKFLIHDGVVWDFIGGEPTLEMDLIDEICDYILYKMYTTNHKWLYCYRILIGSNGLLYASNKVQKFLSKHNQNLHISITIDGSKAKHDLSRVKKDGSGSYDDVVKIIPLWIKQTNNYSTKATFSHNDLPYLKDSIINLWNLGLINVMANVVFENVWENGDDVIYEQQLKLLADYIIDNQLWNDYSVRFFSPTIGYPVPDQEKRINTCGSGNMLAINYRGDFFPCIRFMDSALNNKKGKTIGNAETGISCEKLRAFNALSYDAQSPPQCRTCDIAKGCSWCTGYNYDEAKEDTIFERQTYICKMHQANVRANKYFWQKFEKKTGFVSPLRYNTYTSKSRLNKYLYIYRTASLNTCHTNIDSTLSFGATLSDDSYALAISYCDQNNIIPVHVDFPTQRAFGYYICAANQPRIKDEFTMDLVTPEVLPACKISELSRVIIYSANYDQLSKAYEDLSRLLPTKHLSKINVIIRDYYKWNRAELCEYRILLENLVSLVAYEWSAGHYIQLDIVTNNLFSDSRNYCSAGRSEWALAPNGMLYSCIGEYYDNQPPLANLNDLPAVAELQKAHKDILMCSQCDAKHCKKCYFVNRKLTGESDVAFELHCVKVNMELLAAITLAETLEKMNVSLPFDINKKLQKPFNLDPLVALRGEDSFANNGFHKIL